LQEGTVAFVMHIGEVNDPVCRLGVAEADLPGLDPLGGD
jgi:hypothetical protein